MTAPGISAREFARRDGCAHTLVNRAVRDGHLTRMADGTLDPALVGTGWRLENRRAGNKPEKVSVQAEPHETAEAAAERIISTVGATMTQAEAERVKENYLALLRQLEYDIKSGAVAAISDIAKLIGDQFAQVRTRLLAIPAERAPQLHRLKTVAEVQDALMTIIVEALEGLTGAGHHTTH